MTHTNGIYGFEVRTMEGKPVKLADYKGKILLIVNTASQCGFTPQYSGLEKLYNDYKDSGFIIPGHGGILDKIDGMLFGGPVLYFMLLAMGITHGP